MNILLLATGFAPYAFSENIVNSKLTLAFQDNGWSVQVVSRIDDGPAYNREWQPVWSPLHSITHEVSYAPGSRLIRFIDLFSSATRLCHPIPGVRWARRAVDHARRLHRTTPFDFVISRSPNDVGHLAALAFSEETGVPWVANWNDPPTHLWPAPYTHGLGKIDSYLSSRLLRGVCRKASVVTFPSRRLAEHICKSLSRGPRRVEVIPHIGLVNYAPTNQAESGVFRLCHAGNLSGERDPGCLLQGLAIFIAQEKPQHRVELEIIGVNHPETSKKAAAHGVAGLVTVTGSLGYIEVLHRLAQATVLVLVEAPCAEGIFLPSKLVDYVQVGRPVLCISPSWGTVRDLLKESKGGLFADCTKPMEIAAAITHLYRAWKGGTIAAEYTNKRLWKLFEPASVLRQYEQIFLEIKR